MVQSTFRHVVPKLLSTTVNRKNCVEVVLKDTTTWSLVNTRLERTIVIVMNKASTNSARSHLPTLKKSVIHNILNFLASSNTKIIELKILSHMQHTLITLVYEPMHCIYTIKHVLGTVPSRYKPVKRSRRED